MDFLGKVLPPGFAIVWVSVGLIMMGNTLEEIVNPRLKTHHLFDARRMVALVTGARPKIFGELSRGLEAEGVTE